MKEVVYTFDNRGCYLPDEKAVFETETHMRLIIKPHDFELKVSDEVLRKSCCDGYVIEVSRKGEVRFYDNDRNLLDAVDETQKEFAQVEFSWKQNQLCLNFGYMATVDYYPDCDGEYDRWGTEWISEYKIVYDTVNNKAEIDNIN